MIVGHWNCNSVRLLVLAIAIAAAGGLAASPLTAGELDKLDTSLKLIPADAAFYSTTLRTREQFEAVTESNAWAKIKQMPMVQMGLIDVPDAVGHPGQQGVAV